MNETALKNGWTRVAFGDIVTLSKERSSDPEGDGFERYVGLEHIDSDDLKIRRWGVIADGTTFTSVFRPGQVLFGKRRAYQHKVAVADFSGVCSGDIYVLEPKDSNLLPELLPFICQTDAFSEHAVGTSAGSLSPRTNWKSLAKFEFALPSLKEQKRIAAVLEAASRVMQLLPDARVLVRAIKTRFALNVLLSKHPLTANSSVVNLGDVADITMGQSPPGSAYNPVGQGVPLLNGPTEFGPRYPSPQQFTTQTTKVCQPGDILFCVRGSVARMNIADRKYCIGRGLAAIRGKETISTTEYLEVMLEGLTQIIVHEARGAGSTFPNITAKRLASQKLPLPSMSDQEVVWRQFAIIVSTEAALDERLSHVLSFQKEILKESFGGFDG